MFLSVAVLVTPELNKLSIGCVLCLIDYQHDERLFSDRPRSYRGRRSLLTPTYARSIGVPSRHRPRGSSASRSPSPTRLNDSTHRKIASPGNTASQGACDRNRCAELSIDPQDGSGGCCPSPRNDSDASAMIAAAIASVPCTSTGGTMFGSTW